MNLFRIQHSGRAIASRATRLFESGGWESPMTRMTWEEICRREDCRGRWVALDGCRYDESTGKAAEGAVVDVDDDLAELCQRIRESEWKNCAILFCAEPDGAVEAHPVSSDPFRDAAH